MKEKSPVFSFREANYSKKNLVSQLLFEYSRAVNSFIHNLSTHNEKVTIASKLSSIALHDAEQEALVMVKLYAKDGPKPKHSGNRMTLSHNLVYWEGSGNTKCDAWMVVHSFFNSSDVIRLPVHFDPMGAEFYKQDIWFNKDSAVIWNEEFQWSGEFRDS